MKRFFKKCNTFAGNDLFKIGQVNWYGLRDRLEIRLSGFEPISNIFVDYIEAGNGCRVLT